MVVGFVKTEIIALIAALLSDTEKNVSEINAKEEIQIITRRKIDG